MKEFQINKYITLKLENHRTIIYVKREPFRQCTILVLNIPVTEISDFNKIKSIDEISDNQNGSIDESLYGSELIPLDVIFWGHCSNLQAWYEHNYDTRLLHRSLAFPLLKKLTENGDRLARSVFREEIAKRFDSGRQPTKEYLLNEGYLDYLNQEELDILINPSSYNIEIIQSIIKLGNIDQLNKLELLFYSKRGEFPIDRISIKFIKNFCKLYDHDLLLSFILNNPSILHNFFFQIIGRISREVESIKVFFLEEISRRLKVSTINNYEILKISKEIYTTGYKKQTFLRNFI